MRKSELQGLEVKEVSLVDKAANKRKFLLTKNEGDQEMQEVFKELLETEAIGESKLKAIIKCLSPEAGQAVTGALRLLQGFSDEIPMDVFTGLMKLCCDGMGEGHGEMGDGDYMDGEGGEMGEGDAVSSACKPKKPATMKKAAEQVEKTEEKAEKAEVIEKAVIPFQNLPLGDRNAPWDGTAAYKRVQTWATGTGADAAIDFNKFRKAFLYVGEEPTNLTSYKFQIGDIVDGEMKAMPRGIFAAAAALMGARQGPGAQLTVDEAAQTGMKAVLTRYYDKMAKEFEDEGIVAPWKQKEAEKSKTTKQEAKDNMEKVEKVDIFKADGTIDMEAVPAEMKESVEKLFKQMTDAQALIKKAEDDKLTAEYIEKAKALKNIAQKPEEFGIILKQITQAAPEQAKTLYEILKAADASLSKAGLFAEIGTSGNGEATTAWGKIEKSAEAMATKEKITKAEAVSRIMEENPQLYNDYLNEQKGAK